MILPNNASILRNIKDSFYYNGIEISKENFSIEEFAIVCDKINDFKHQLRQEKFLMDISQKGIVISATRLLNDKNIQLLCKIDRKNIYFGLYDISNNKIMPFTKEIFKSLIDDDMYNIAFELNKTAKLISRGAIQITTIKNSTVLYTFENYIDTIEKSRNSFQNTYELEFVNGYG